MSDSTFRAVLEGLQQRPSSVGESPTRPTSVAVLGAGPVGLLLACEALAAGLDVRLTSLYGQELQVLREAGAITVRGVHLVGSYAIGGAGRQGPAIDVVDSIDQAVKHVDLIMLAAPALSHSTYAGVLAPVLADGQTVLLVPGRFLGVVEFAETLAAHMASADVTLSEVAHPPYLATGDGAAVSVLGLAKSLPCSTLPVDASATLCARLESILPMLCATDSPLDTAFAAITGVLNVAPLAVNASVLDAGDEVRLADLVTQGLSGTIMKALDIERREVGFNFGVRDLVPAATWLRAAFGAESDQIEDPDLHNALTDLDAFDDVRIGWDGGPRLTDDVANVLVPLASAGRVAGVSTPITDMIITLASVLVGSDLSAQGRTLGRVGLGNHPPSELRRHLAAAGARRPRAAMTWQKV